MKEYLLWLICIYLAFSMGTSRKIIEEKAVRCKGKLTHSEVAIIIQESHLWPIVFYMNSDHVEKKEKNCDGVIRHE